MKVIDIYYNPTAGAKTIEIADYLEQSFSALNLIRVFSKEELQSIIYEKIYSHQERIILMGGDGTVSAAAQVLAHQTTALGLIPTGHGNDFAHSIGLPTDPISALTVAVCSPRIEKFDLGKVQNRFFINGFGIGFDAMVAAASRSKHYGWNALKNLMRCKPFSVRMMFYANNDAKIFEAKVLMVIFSNGKREGRGFRIHKFKNPLQSGSLGMVVAGQITKIKRMAIIPLFFTNFFDIPKEISFFGNIKGALVENNSQFFHADGEILPPRKKLKISVATKALNVVVGNERGF